MSQPQQVAKVTCGQCHYEFDMGAHVCQGCTGSIVYGASDYEMLEARKIGGMMWGFIAVFLLYLLPMLLNSEFGYKTTMGWGMGVFGLAIVGVAVVWGAFTNQAKVKAEKAGLIRTFRH
jgi:hypothetical protein